MVDDHEGRMTNADGLPGLLAVHDANAFLTRRALLRTAAGVVAAGILAPVAEWPEGLLNAAQAASSDLVTDTINGFVAFVLPGRDVYSRAQGATTDGPGGIGAGATRPLIVVLDFAAADQDGRPVPQSGAVAALLNAAARRVDPNASHGSFISLFSRLSFAEKRAAYLRLETDPVLGAQLTGLTTLVGLMAYSEAPVLDRTTGRLRGRPVGWRMSSYAGPADGHPELLGYYRGHRTARS